MKYPKVLAEYNEAQMDNSGGPQKSSLVGETYQELVKRLDEGKLKNMYSIHHLLVST